MSQRWKLTLEYDGTNFVGWQIQDIPFSVQEVLEEAVFQLCGERCRVHTAGRTDSGVHAVAQVAHVDLPKDYTPHAVRNALNVYVHPHAVSVIK
ncbi:MAG: truA, partial [Alphaproteobacteria bacterium]|nr:truA [Alphaproteobacteria bacterium]